MNRGLMIGAFLTLLFVALAFISFFWIPYDIETLEISNKLKSPNAKNLLGTDHFGRDIFSMIMMGARTSIAVALLAVGIGIIVGVPLGLFQLLGGGPSLTNSLCGETILSLHFLLWSLPSSLQPFLDPPL